MKKFILIDNSVRDNIGHYYQYAIFCLESAKDSGYETFLVTNKNFVTTQKNSSFTVIPIYTNSFWENADIDPSAINVFNKVKNSKFEIIFYLLYKIFGERVITHFAYKEKIKRFQNESKSLFEKIFLDDGDVVFIPTSGLVELIALLKCINDIPSLKKTSWHLLFRRNLYGSEFNKNVKRFLGIHPLRYACRAFHNILNHKVHFYTDSEGLSEQYSKFNLDFDVLPIPHTTHGQGRSPSGTLKISYLGDARTEKGYQYLPHIVADLWLDYVKTNKISFEIQSNYNTPKGEYPAVVARNQLQLFQSDKVNLIMDSLSMEDYQKLLLSTNILLLPYDANSYYVRTSGIMAEALSCGIPVVVPAGTWLSQQFIAEVYKFHQAMRDNFVMLDSFNESIDLNRKFHEKKSGTTEKKLIIDEKKKETTIFFSIPTSASHLLISSFFDPNNKGSFLMEITQITSGGLVLKRESELVEKSHLEFASNLISIDENTTSVRLGLKELYSKSNMKISKISIDILKAKKTENPMSLIGIVYNDPYEISKKVKNIIDNYDHYRKSALEFSKNYYTNHNATALIQRIIKNA